MSSRQGAFRKMTPLTLRQKPKDVPTLRTNEVDSGVRPIKPEKCQSGSIQERSALPEGSITTNGTAQALAEPPHADGFVWLFGFLEVVDPCRSRLDYTAYFRGCRGFRSLAFPAGLELIIH